WLVEARPGAARLMAARRVAVEHRRAERLPVPTVTAADRRARGGTARRPAADLARARVAGRARTATAAPAPAPAPTVAARTPALAPAPALGARAPGARAPGARAPTTARRQGPAAATP